MALLTSLPATAEVLINEILFNPPGTDSPNEYIELRGTPNLILSAGTYLLTLDGDATGNPGAVQNLFDLSGRMIGGNGFLVLLQKNSPYAPDTNATVLVNTNSGAGWGSGSGSSIGHWGKSGLTDLKNPSVSFFLIQTTNPPAVGEDLDGNNNGTLAKSVLTNWTVLDSVGVLDADGAGDIAYGAVNLRLNSLPGSAAQASGVVVPVGFVPKYVGRTGNSTGSTGSDWVAADGLGGSAPNWTLGNLTNTVPTSLANAPLNHIGTPNFGAPPFPGVLLTQPTGTTMVSEGGMTGSYTLGLNTPSTGAVTIQINCSAQLQASTDGGASFSAAPKLVLTNTAARTVMVRALDNALPEGSPHWRGITHTVSASADTVRYPLSTLVAPLNVGILDNDLVLLSELKVNPPGTNDAPNEFIELMGTPGLALSNVYLLALEGNAGSAPGTVTYALNLSSARLGSSGTLMAVATNHPYSLPAGTSIITDPSLSQPGGALGNGTISFLLVSSPVELRRGDDLDRGNDGVLENLSLGSTIIDAVGWSDGDKNDLVYGGVALAMSSGTPDAATRFPGNTAANAASAWFCGNLVGPGGDSVVYDVSGVSADFPAGTLLSPGLANRLAPAISPVAPISGVIGDPTNPKVEFTVSDAETPTTGLVVTASSSNPAVVPDINLVISAGIGGARTLSLNPIGVGYADILLLASDGSMTGRVAFPYAASAPGRPGGVWHLGASDGSTAITVDPDLMLIGDDENQTIRLYPRQNSSLSLRPYDMAAFLDLPDSHLGLPREVDVEASTRVGNRLFWMGSHGHAATGESRTNRTRIFTTDLSGSRTAANLTYVGRYDYLKVDLIDWDSQNRHGKGTNYYGLEASDADGVPPKAPDGSGWAIEGLAMMPGNTNGAYVAFRAPIVPATNRTYALIVPVLNFARISANNSPPGSCVFGAPIELDLYGRGIRSLEGNTNGYVIIAGPAAASIGPYPQDFRLYTWTGNPADQPQQRTADLSDLNPEGIVELPPGPWSADSQVEVLSDNGGTVFYGDDVKAKVLTVPNFKKCRSDWIALGAVIKPAPIITSFQVTGATLTLRWRALKGERYRIQTATEVNAATWTDLPGEMVAPGPYVSQEISRSASRSFYRVAVLP